MEKKEIHNLVINQVEQLVDTFPSEQQFKVNSNTALIGKGSNIDSLSLVSIIVDLEMIFTDKLDSSFSLMDEHALTREISPFESIANLVDYIYERVLEIKG